MATSTKTAPSLDDLFAKADKQVAPTTQQATVPASQRPVLDLPAEVAAEFETFIGYASVAKKIETQCSNQKEVVQEGCFDAYTEYVWNRKSTPPKNPQLQVKEGSKVKHSAIFQVQGRFKVDVEIGEIAADQSPEDAVVAAIQEITDLSEEDATNLVNNEIDFTPDRGFRSFTKIFQEGSDEEKASLVKLMTYVMADGSEKTGKSTVDAFTLEDRQNLMYNTAKATVIDPKKFMDRLPNYVHSLEQLRAVLTVIKPTHVYPSHIAFMKGSNVSEQTEALKGVAATMLGISDD
tara:strand:- start:2753 stop:3628 length:876 start_codon:yes stop_codon:yes gene_type:complete